MARRKKTVAQEPEDDALPIDGGEEPIITQIHKALLRVEMEVDSLYDLSLDAQDRAGGQEDESSIYQFVLRLDVLRKAVKAATGDEESVAALQTSVEDAYFKQIPLFRGAMTKAEREAAARDLASTALDSMLVDISDQLIARFGVENGPKIGKELKRLARTIKRAPK